VLNDGLAAVEAACAEALADGVHSADVILNLLACRRDPGPVVTILAPAALQLRQMPIADCARYGGRLMEPSDIIERMIRLELLGMRAAYDGGDGGHRQAP
jgi:hypothetical protein